MEEKRRNNMSKRRIKRRGRKTDTNNEEGI